MYAGKPIIGVVGGVGSGKSFVANLFGELGCLVINSDEQVAEAYRRPEVVEALRSWWGDEVVLQTGEINRSAVAGKVFTDPTQRQRLEQLVHPIVGQLRDAAMAAAASDVQVLAYVWDTPLLFEVDLARHCDAVVFVDAPLETRLARVAASRGWSPEELLRREKSQMPLDNKREMSDYIVRNTASADQVRSQVREVLSRILARVNQGGQ